MLAKQNIPAAPRGNVFIGMLSSSPLPVCAVLDVWFPTSGLPSSVRSQATSSSMCSGTLSSACGSSGAVQRGWCSCTHGGIHSDLCATLLQTSFSWGWGSGTQRYLGSSRRPGTAKVSFRLHRDKYYWSEACIFSGFWKIFLYPYLCSKCCYIYYNWHYI